MYAIFETGGKQYKVSEGDFVKIEKLQVVAGETVTFSKVLAVGGDSVTVGAPYVDGASVVADVVECGKSKKIYVFRYKSKKNEKKKIGHRQSYTKVQIKKIEC